METFSQHELEIIEGHKKILKTNNFLSVRSDINNMLSVLQGETGKQFIEDEKQLEYTYRNYLSVSKKLANLTEKEFDQIDFSVISELK
ncbi:hypothetical protein IGI39_004772 [Enterococcus sp. AZ135]|uniref:hypothetical protein n=1 Tax=unclassified Enterococcus TaxID=2608891 RepID=UPI003F225F4B